jgi:hypothetical protein
MEELPSNNHNKMILNNLYVFLNSFGGLHPLCKYDLLEENNPFFLLHSLLYMNVKSIYLHFTYYCNILASRTLTTLF